MTIHFKLHYITLRYVTLHYIHTHTRLDTYCNEFSCMYVRTYLSVIHSFDAILFHSIPFYFISLRFISSLHSFMHAFIHSFTDLFIRSFIHSFIQ